MKKLLCVFLSLLLTVFACVPAMAADLVDSTLPAATPVSDSTTQYTLTFKQPTHSDDPKYDYTDGYWFAKSKDGDYNYILETEHLNDPEWLYEHDYLYDEGNDRYVLAKDVLSSYFPENPVYYTIEKMPESMAVNKNEIVTFKVATSPKYNQTTVVVRANGVNVEPNVKGEYSVVVNQDIIISVVERNAAGEEVLLRSHFFVYLPKGEDGEYRCRTLENTNYTVVYYGDSFDFRLILGKDSVVNNLSVTVQRGSNTLSEELGFDPSSFLNMIGLGAAETLTSYGTDATGARLYRVENVTTDISISVDGVKTKESSDTMQLILRILRMLLNLLGINLPFLQDMNVTHAVNVINNGSDLDFAVLQGAAQDEINSNVYHVGTGDNMTLIVYKYAADQDVSVTWAPGNEIGGNYSSEWIAGYDQNSETTYYYAIFNIDNIEEDTVVTINPGI